MSMLPEAKLDILLAHHASLEAGLLGQVNSEDYVRITRELAELNPLIVGWAAYYNGVVEAEAMSRYDDLVEQRLINWASKRHPGKARDWLLSRYWRRVGEYRRVFATHDGVQLRAYQQTRILRG